jgi:hypothetical protein
VPSTRVDSKLPCPRSRSAEARVSPSFAPAIDQSRTIAVFGAGALPDGEHATATASRPRVAEEGESFISPEVQRKKIAEWAKLYKVEVEQWWEEIDQSEAKLQRRMSQEALARCHSAEAQAHVRADRARHCPPGWWPRSTRQSTNE